MAWTCVLLKLKLSRKRFCPGTSPATGALIPKAVTMKNVTPAIVGFASVTVWPILGLLTVQFAVQGSNSPFDGS
jgi:hypothetical protein